MKRDEKKRLQEPKHLSGSKNMSGIFSKQTVSCENKKKKLKKHSVGGSEYWNLNLRLLKKNGLTQHVNKTHFISIADKLSSV